MAEISERADPKADPNWPKWFYGPAGAAEVFQAEEEVPEGWQDHPSKIVLAAAEHIDL